MAIAGAQVGTSASGVPTTSGPGTARRRPLADANRVSRAASPAADDREDALARSGIASASSTRCGPRMTTERPTPPLTDLRCPGGEKRSLQEWARTAR